MGNEIKLSFVPDQIYIFDCNRIAKWKVKSKDCTNEILDEKIIKAGESTIVCTKFRKVNREDVEMAMEAYKNLGLDKPFKDK